MGGDLKSSLELFSDNACATCGASGPMPVLAFLVWIPDDGETYTPGLLPLLRGLPFFTDVRAVRHTPPPPPSAAVVIIVDVCGSCDDSLEPTRAAATPARDRTLDDCE